MCFESNGRLKIGVQHRILFFYALSKKVGVVLEIRLFHMQYKFNIKQRSIRPQRHKTKESVERAIDARLFWPNFQYTHRKQVQRINYPNGYIG